MSYSAAFLDCFLHTKHAGVLTGEHVVSSLHNSAQSFNSLQLFLRVRDNVIVEASFQASSTPALIAMGEYVCRWVMGKQLTECQQLQKEQILAELELPTTFLPIAHLMCQALGSHGNSSAIFS